jgi:hypothetical protein
MLLCGRLVFICAKRRALCHVDETAFLLLTSQNAQPKYYMLKQCYLSIHVSKAKNN